MNIPAPKDDDERGSGPRIVRGAKTLSELVDAKVAAKKRRGPPKLSGERVETARAEVATYAASGEWDAATPLHLVLFYESRHAEVYGTPPLELDAKARFLAVGAAKSVVEKYFDGDVARAAHFVFWVWQREQERETWRRANGRDGGRIGWRLQFSASLVSDYRVHGERSR